MAFRDRVQGWLADGGFPRGILALVIKLVVETGIGFAVATGFVSLFAFLLIPPTITATSITLGPGFAGVTIDEPTIPRWAIIVIASLWMGRWFGNKTYCRLV